MGAYIVIINGSLPLGNSIGHLTLPQLIPHFGNLHWQMDNFGFPYRIELRFGTQALENHWGESPWSHVNPIGFRLKILW